MFVKSAGSGSHPLPPYRIPHTFTTLDHTFKYNSWDILAQTMTSRLISEACFLDLPDAICGLLSSLDINTNGVVFTLSNCLEQAHYCLSQAKPEEVARRIQETSSWRPEKSDRLNQRELEQFLDASLNDLIIHRLVASANILMPIQGEEIPEMSSGSRYFLTKIIRSRYDSLVKPIYHQAFQSAVEELRQQGKSSIALVSLGCGTGDRDIPLLMDLRDRNAGTPISIIGIDAYAPVEGNHIGRDGIFIPQAMPVGQNLAQFLSEHINYIPDPSQGIIIFAKYAIHHFADRTLAAFIADCQGADRIILLEEPTTEEESRDLMRHTRRLAYDLLAAYAFDEGWADGIREDSKQFRMLPLHMEDLNKHGFTIADTGIEYPFTVVTSLDISKSLRQ